MNLQIIFQKILPWAINHGIKIAVILVAAYIANRCGKVFILKLIKSLAKTSGNLKQREKTLTNVFVSTLNFIIWTITVLMILPELGVNITPLLAGVGILGLAIGMGARDLIKDYLAGIFILLEDQYQIDEEIDVGSTKGKVVALNLRRTILKSPDEVLHFIPNGQIKKVSNLSRKNKF